MIPRKTDSHSTETLLRLLKQPWLVGFIFLVAGLLAYGPALQGERIWDDDYLVGQNPFFKSPIFALEVFRHYLFFDSFSTYYRPVQNLSYMWDYWLWRGNPFGYHLTNVLLHVGSGFLLFRLLRGILPGLLGGMKTDRSEVAGIGAFLIALIWTVHPMHNAAVAYIAGRADSLASLFALTAWLLVRHAPSVKLAWQRRGCWVVAMVSMLLALCSKEIALLWFLLFLGHLFVFEKGITLRAKLGLFGGALTLFSVYCWLHALPDYRAPMEDGPAAPFTSRLLLMLRAIGDYTGLIFFPSRLLMDRTLTSPAMARDLPTWLGSLRYEYLSVLGLAAIAAAIWFCMKRGSGRPLRIFGALWFLIGFLPISNLFPLNAQVAEHWIYLASIGYLAFLAGCVLLLGQRARQIACWIVAIAAVALGVRTAVRAADWRSPETFYLATIEAGGGTPRIVGNLAAVYGQRGDWQRQEKILRRALELFPTYAPARMSLGNCLANQGRAAEAEALLQMNATAAAEVSRHFPRTWSGALTLAGVRAKAGETDAALAVLAEARARFPETWELARYESDLLAAKSGPRAALPAVERYAAGHWWHQDSWLTVGKLRAAAGDPAGAIAAMQAAARLDIHDPAPFANIARLELSQNRPEAARLAQEAAIARDPDQPSRYLVLAALLEKLDRKAEAAEALRRAAELRASVVSAT